MRGLSPLQPAQDLSARTCPRRLTAHPEATPVVAAGVRDERIGWEMRGFEGFLLRKTVKNRYYETQSPHHDSDGQVNAMTRSSGGN